MTEQSGYLRIDAELKTDAGTHFATCDSLHSRRDHQRPKETAWHLMIDRPLYRPGDRLQGRVAVRENWINPEPKEPGVLAEVLANAPVRLAIKVGAEELASLTGHTNNEGTFPFDLEIPKTSSLGGLSFQLFLMSQEHPDRLVSIGYQHQGVICTFKRPPLLLDIDSPTQWTPGDANPIVRLSAKWPNGAKASHLKSKATLSYGVFSNVADLSLDDEGQCELHIPLKEWDFSHTRDHQIDVALETTAPDGQTIRSGATIHLPTTSDSGSFSGQQGRSLQAPRLIFVGETAQVHLSGMPGDVILLSVVERSFRQSHVLRLTLLKRAACTARTT
jgi:hypothetical protein